MVTLILQLYCYLTTLVLCLIRVGGKKSRKIVREMESEI